MVVNVVDFGVSLPRFKPGLPLTSSVALESHLSSGASVFSSVKEI